MLGKTLKSLDNSCFWWGQVWRPTLIPFNWPIVLQKQSIRSFSRGGSLLDAILQFGQQRRLLAIRPLNKTLHPILHRFSKKIIPWTGFSHSLDLKPTSHLVQAQKND
jgi:hypothetical protein